MNSEQSVDEWLELLGDNGRVVNDPVVDIDWLDDLKKRLPFTTPSYGWVTRQTHPLAD